VIASHNPATDLSEADLVLGLRDGSAALVLPGAEAAAAIAELYR